MASKLAAVFMGVHGASAHGRITFPPSRQGGTFEVAGTACGEHDGGTQVENGCGWLTNAVEIPGKPTLIDPALLTTAESIADPLDHAGVATRPWRSPGNAPVKSPCGNNIYHSELDGLDLPPNPTQTTWRQGEVVTVASSIYINHGGGWSWRLCPKSASVTEACFQEHVLDFADSNQTLRFTDGHDVVIPARHTQDGKWARNPVPAALEEGQAHPDAFQFPMPAEGLIPAQWDYSVVERVVVPESIASGEYLLSWRWDCELSRQVWLNCADITVAAAEEAVVV
jgi:hypothetical protein